MTPEWMNENIRQRFFQKRFTRDLMRMWQAEEKAERVQTMALGAGGALRKKGEHSIRRQHLGLGIRAVNKETANRKSNLWMVFKDTQAQFLQWRSAGQYVDRDDILADFDFRLGLKISQLEKKRDERGGLNEFDTKTLAYAIQRRDAHARSPQAQRKTVDQMQRLFRSRFLKPQRLIHLSLSQEKDRLLESWQFWDVVLDLACFRPLETLGEHVLNAKQFRDNVKATVICMSDQLPFWIKLVPGKQLYAPGEFARSKKKLTDAERECAMAQRSGGGSQKSEKMLRADEVDLDGCTQLRGSSNSEQDKFRITADVEQVCYGFLDDQQEPVADWGITSVIFPGAHFRASNVSEDRCWLESDVFSASGIQKIWEKGQPVPGGLGSALLDFRDQHRELWDKMIALGFRFYQQPAGFEDSVISKWKIREQLETHGQTITLRDLFGGALAESSREQMSLCQQLAAWIRSKITAICQVADTHVIRPMKIRKLQKDIGLRRELMKLAELEKTSVVFKCGMYEIMRSLYQVVSELKAEWKADQYLLKAMYQNGWLSMRPNWKDKRLVRTENQAWCKGFKIGSHRIQQEWLQHRFDHIDENGVPKATPWS